MSESNSSIAEEVILQGVAASPGTVIGRAFIHAPENPVVEEGTIKRERISHHINRFKEARRQLCDDWEKLREEEPQKESKDILSAQIEIILDPELAEEVQRCIEEDRQPAQNAINKAFGNYIKLLSESGSEKMESRMIDLTDIRDRLMEAAGDGQASGFSIKGDILVAKEISPREVIHLANQNVKGFVMEKGGHTSHAAIIARSMGIPAVVGVKGATRHVVENTRICLHGENGLVAFNPSGETCEQAKVLAGGSSQSKEEKRAICERANHTVDDHIFKLRANIEFPEELRHVDQYCAEGIGLLRTESMYLARQEFGNMQQQVAFYERFLQNTGDEPVVIRLFDVGGDKFQESESKENNPFLGWRGIRMLLDERAILRTQLKAILRIAGKYPERVKLLIPMVSSVHEITQVREEIKACRQQLAAEGEPHEQLLPVGMMVEIPSAALQADYFTEKVDFFSIGTNDLTQYMLAVDRGNAFISGMYDQRHPAMWKAISHVTKAAKSSGTGVEICGELAAYPVAAACLIGLGISVLSMTPVSIPPVKKMLTERSFKEMEKLAEQVLHCEELQDIKTLFDNWKTQ